MMSSSAISDNLTLKRSPGIKFTGNYGCGHHLLFVVNNRPPTKPKRKLVSDFASPSSLKVPAGLFRPVSTAPGVSLNTYVTNALPTTQVASVRPKQPNPVLALSELRVREAQLKFHAFHSRPATPIKVDRVDFFYDKGMTGFYVVISLAVFMLETKC